MRWRISGICGLLLQAVSTMNESAPNVAKAPVRMISRLDLVGGDGLSGAAATVGASVGGGDGDMSEFMEGYDMFEDGGEDGDGYGESPFGNATSTVAFEPADEFGNNIETLAVVSEGLDGTQGAISRGGNRRQEIRYVALDENQPFRERGFYMSVLIDQQQIARFLITLSNSDWPIRIVRFHVGPNPQGVGSTGNRGIQNQFAFGGDDESDYASQMDVLDFDEGDFEFDFGGGGGGGGGYGPQEYVNDSALAGAFSHPDLVQLEVLGAITFFNPLPEDVLAKVTAALGEASAVSVEPATTDPDTPLPESGTEEASDAGQSVPDEDGNPPTSPTNDGGAETDPGPEASVPATDQTP